MVKAHQRKADQHRREDRRGWLARRWAYPSCFLAGMILVWVITIVVLHYRTETIRVAGPVPKVTPESWGVLKEKTLMLERPDEAFVQAAPKEIIWMFGGALPAGVRELIQSLGLSSAQQAALLEEQRWQVSASGIAVRPSLETVRELSPDSRRRLYEVLARTAENLAPRFPYVFRGAADEWFAGCDLSEERLAEVKRMVYQKGELSIFADIIYFQLTAPSNEVVTLARHVGRVPTVLAQVELDEHTDLAALDRYWFQSETEPGLKPLLSSLTRVRGGASINVVTLLPPFARLLLYSYPQPRQNFPPNANCVWSSMNFFNAQPDSRFVDEQFTGQVLHTQYRAVPRADAFGDIVMLYVPDSSGSSVRMVHMCVQVAGDLVFTKNGGDVYQPWVLMRLADVRALFTSETGMQTGVFRRNGRT